MPNCYICGRKTNVQRNAKWTACSPCLVIEVRHEAINEAWIETHSERPSNWAHWVMTMDAHEALG